jgi:hypothetical protein
LLTSDEGGQRSLTHQLSQQIRCGETLMNVSTGTDFKCKKKKRAHKSVELTRHTTEVDEPQSCKASKKLYVPVIKHTPAERN